MTVPGCSRLLRLLRFPPVPPVPRFPHRGFLSDLRLFIRLAADLRHEPLVCAFSINHKGDLLVCPEQAYVEMAVLACGEDGGGFSEKAAYSAAVSSLATELDRSVVFLRVE